mgnify:CR=1 FL=1
MAANITKAMRLTIDMAAMAGITVSSGSHVEQCNADAGHALTRQRRRASGKYLFQHSHVWRKVAVADMYVALHAAHPQQHKHAARLTRKRGYAGTGYAHVEHKYKYRGQHDVDACSRKYAEH